MLLIAILSSTALVYLDTGGAPAQWEKAADGGIRSVLAERGVTLLPEPSPSTPPDVKLAAAKRDLEKGIAAYRELALDTAVTALTASQNTALAIPESREAPAVTCDSRMYLGVVALANGNTKAADEWFRKVAVMDPERRLSSKSFAPDIVAAYEKARKAVEALPQVELQIDAPADAAVLVDGRTATSPVRVAGGEHFVSAVSELGVAGDVGTALSVQLRIVPDGAKSLASARAAAKSRDDAALGRALESLAVATGAQRVIVYDLRSKEGRVEAPMRLKEAGRPQFRFAVAELGATPANVEKPIRNALTQLFSAQVASSRTNGREKPPVTKSRYGWAWWAGGAVAVLAAGAAGAALAQPPPGEDKVTVTVEK